VLRCGNERAVVLSYSLAHRIEEVERDGEFRVDIQVRLVRNDERSQMRSALVSLSCIDNFLLNETENKQHLRVRYDVVLVRKQALEIEVYKVCVRLQRGRRVPYIRIPARHKLLQIQLCRSHIPL